MSSRTAMSVRSEASEPAGSIEERICNAIRKLQIYSDEKEKATRAIHRTSKGYTFGELEAEKPEVLLNLCDLVCEYKRAHGISKDGNVTNRLECEELDWPSKQFFKSFQTFINKVSPNARPRRGGTVKGRKRTKRTKSRKQRRNR